MAAAVASRQTVAPGPAVFVPSPPPAVPAAADKVRQPSERQSLMHQAARPARRPSAEAATAAAPTPERKATADRVKTLAPVPNGDDGAAKAEAVRARHIAALTSGRRRVRLGRAAPAATRFLALPPPRRQ